MQRKVNRIKLFINDTEKAKETANNIQIELLKHNFEIVEDNYDLALSIGGDGSFLRMVKETNFDDNILYIGVNAGTLGFLQEIDIKDTINFINRLENNDYKIEDISIAELNIITNKDEEHYFSLNEITIRKNNFNKINIPIYIDNELLENYSGDGILISTSPGSTAYNLSLGGPIIYNTLKTLVITPIAPLNSKIYSSLTNPIVIPDNKCIDIYPNDDNNDLFIMIDGINYEIKDIQKIEIKLANRNIKCIRMNEFHFIKIINNKLLER